MRLSFSKYHNRRHNGYASKKEARLAADLGLLASAGEIQNFQQQVKFELLPKQEGRLRTERPLTYIADFVYDDSQGHHVIDAKGFRTREYIIKRKLMRFIHKIEVEEF